LSIVSKYFSPSTDISKKTTREESPMSNFLFLVCIKFQKRVSL
jgi:hypothetical protein